MAKDSKVKIVVDSSATDIENQKANLSFERRNFTRTIARSNHAANVLDVHDSFDELKIDPSFLAQSSSTGIYGIPYDSEVHRFGQDVILSHQKVAAQRFLRELRGFGLLADVVGSGKTFEAGLVISELSFRNMCRSLLLVVPDQVFDTWVVTMERRFGMGEGVLLRADENFLLPDVYKQYLVKDGEFRYLSRPVIVKMDDFVKWDKAISSLLFDVIVVDEAHNLCLKDSGSVNGLKLLSSFMQVKNKAGYPYCLLLSATPHNGNLEDMYPLWYFIRYKGGVPSDFSSDESFASQEYVKEKAYYIDKVCYGAKTVSEFIAAVRLVKIKSEYHDALLSYCPDFEQKSMAAKLSKAADFEQKMLNEQQRQSLRKEIAAAYHNEVLRPIMIRQENHLHKSKKIANILFYPTLELPSVLELCFRGEHLTVNLTDFGLKKKCIHCDDGIVDFAAFASNREKDTHLITDLLFEIISKLEKEYGSANAFLVADPIRYYKEQLYTCAFSANRFGNDITNDLRLTNKRPIFDLKLEETKAILKQNKGERILIFFDYDLAPRQSLKNKLLEALQEDEELSSRLLIGSDKNKTQTINAFAEKPDAVLLVLDPKFTEGANLQDSAIIINFEIPCDPLSMDQRIGRIFRLGQKEDVRIYSLADMTSLEGYVLLYFTAIGIMDSNSGDATIIAGNNSDKMLVAKCPSCGRVNMVPKDLYDEDSEDVYCSATPSCRRNGEKGTKMVEISVYNFECESCGRVLQRDFNDDSGAYRCLAINNDGKKGKMCNSGKDGDRVLFCNSSCALSHCDILEELHCPLAFSYKEYGIDSDIQLFDICRRCKNRSECLTRARRDGSPCAFYHEGFSSEPVLDYKIHQVQKCSHCPHATCSPRPHIINFDDKWEATCPNCHGKLKKVASGTFKTYIKNSWRFSTHNAEGDYFVKDLLEETRRASVIKEILSLDEEKK